MAMALQAFTMTSSFIDMAHSRTSRSMPPRAANLRWRTGVWTWFKQASTNSKKVSSTGSSISADVDQSSREEEEEREERRC
eukprot:751667-Hanusia_phi.AAC.1